MVGDHEVLVAAVGVDREASHVVFVERADGFHPDVELSGQGGIGMFLDGGSRRGGEVGVVSLGGSYAFLGLCEVALDGLVIGLAILGSIGVGKSLPGGEVFGFYGG